MSKIFKDYLKLALVFLLVTIILPTYGARAVGTFQITYPTSTSLPDGKVGKPYNITFQYLYSGNNFSNISIIGDTNDMPPLKLGEVHYGTNGFDSITASGTPGISRKYNFTLVLTDNNGALLTQPYTLNVSPSDNIFIINPSLPDGYEGQSYFGSIQVVYSGLRPNFEISDAPQGVFSQMISNPGLPGDSGDGTLTQRLTSSGLKVGTYQIQVKVFILDKSETKTFSFNIIKNEALINTKTPLPVPSIVPTSTPVILIATSKPKNSEIKNIVKTPALQAVVLPTELSTPSPTPSPLVSSQIDNSKKIPWYKRIWSFFFK